MGASGRAEPQVRRMTALEQAEGPRGQHAAPAAPTGEDERCWRWGGGCYSLPVMLTVVIGLEVLDDAPERSGSENRHDDVPESESQ